MENDDADYSQGFMLFMRPSYHRADGSELGQEQMRTCWSMWRNWRRVFDFRQILRVLLTSQFGMRVIMKGAEGFVAMKIKVATLVATVKQYAMMRANETKTETERRGPRTS